MLPTPQAPFCPTTFECNTATTLISPLTQLLAPAHSPPPHTPPVTDPLPHFTCTPTSTCTMPLSINLCSERRRAAICQLCSRVKKLEVPLSRWSTTSSQQTRSGDSVSNTHTAATKQQHEPSRPPAIVCLSLSVADCGWYVWPCCCYPVEFDINQINSNINAKSKEIGQKKKVHTSNTHQQPHNATTPQLHQLPNISSPCHHFISATHCRLHCRARRMPTT